MIGLMILIYLLNEYLSSRLSQAMEVQRFKDEGSTCGFDVHNQYEPRTQLLCSNHSYNDNMTNQISTQFEKNSEVASPFIRMVQSLHLHRVPSSKVGNHHGFTDLIYNRSGIFCTGVLFRRDINEEWWRFINQNKNIHSKIIWKLCSFSDMRITSFNNILWKITKNIFKLTQNCWFLKLICK